MKPKEGKAPVAARRPFSDQGQQVLGSGSEPWDGDSGPPSPALVQAQEIPTPGSAGQLSGQLSGPPGTYGACAPPAQRLWPACAKPSSQKAACRSPGKI